MVADAMRLWKEIPTSRLPEAVDEALNTLGGYPWKNGAVVQAFRDPKNVKPLELGSGVRHLGAEVREKMDGFDAYWNSLSEEKRKEELEFRAKVCRESMAKLVGGAA